MVSNHSGIKQDVNDREISGLSPNLWMKGEIPREMRNYLYFSENWNADYQIFG